MNIIFSVEVVSHSPKPITVKSNGDIALVPTRDDYLIGVGM